MPNHWTQTDTLVKTASAGRRDDAPAERARALALPIAEIAVAHSKLGLLTHDLADFLVRELAADVAAFFWCRPLHRRASSPHAAHATHAALQSVASVARDGGLDPTLSRHLKASGYRALSRSQLVSRVGRAGATSDELTHTLALPLGTPAPWAVLALHWAVSDDPAAAERAALLRHLAPALITALRPAHAVDEAMQQEAAHSPRRAVFAMTSEAILTVDEDFTIRETNPAFTKILGWHERAVVGRRCSDILRCRDDRKMLLCGTPRCPLREALDTETATPVRDLNWQTRSGKLCEVSANFTARQSEHDARAVIVARDVTLLNAANRMRANFISMVSHELRTPLNSINGFLEIVLESPVGPLNERQREFLNYARVSTQQLTTLVEDILFISKADSGQFTLRLEQVDVPELVTHVTQTLQAAADRAQVAFELDLAEPLPSLHADGLRLQQVLSNLAGNAIKFSPPEGTVKLSAALRDDGTMLFSVRDQGRGVALEDHARIFERFYQSESSVRNRSGGYGLGLSIAKLIVEQHNGRIWVESTPGEGATFSFTVPADTTTAGAGPLPSSGETGATGTVSPG